MKELAPEDASIESYSDFESDRFAVGRLRRRAFGGKKVPKTVFYVQKTKKRSQKTKKPKNQKTAPKKQKTDN